MMCLDSTWQNDTSQSSATRQRMRQKKQMHAIIKNGEMMYNKHKIIKLPGCFSGSMHSGDWPQIIEDSGNVRGSCYRQVKKKKKKHR